MWKIQRRFFSEFRSSAEEVKQNVSILHSTSNKREKPSKDIQKRNSNFCLFGKTFRFSIDGFFYLEIDIGRIVFG